MDPPSFPKPEDFAADKRVQLVDETGCYVFTDPGDGTEYQYDAGKGAWFPMWNKSLVEQQQSAYGAEDEAPLAEDQASAKRKARGSTKRRENTSIYISGLPRDATEEEVAQYFSQCGTIMPDLVTNKPRVKLYRDEEGAPKGDALVTYFKAPSVQLALDILDDSRFRPADTEPIRVQEAEFQSRAADDRGSEKPKRPRVDAKQAQKRLNRLEKQVLAYYVRGECEKVGKVTSVKVHDKTEEGVIAVKFKDEVAAKACVKVMNGRFFAGRQVEAAICDGHARYRLAGDGSAKAGAGAPAAGGGDDDEQRMERYAQWLDSGS
ncbi:hypothetical protein GGF46_002779 [Coemansia sp. RSA 552]|nr:hypothetical protein GGF46_002779 [Coemansia sp. RSA 552]